MKASIKAGRGGSELTFENLNAVDDYVSCIIDVQSEGFTARRPFHIRSFSKTISDLERLHADLKGKVKFSEGYEDDEVVLECDKFGHVIVSGELYLHSENYHCLEFSFVTDQTFLGPFVKELNTFRETGY